MALLAVPSHPILSLCGTNLKSVFTIAALARYRLRMLLLFAAALVTPTVLPSWAHGPVAPVVQARATVRIIPSATLWLGHPNRIPGQRLRTTQVTTPHGIRPARLVEFE